MLLETKAGSISLDTTLALLQTSAAEKDSASEVRISAQACNIAKLLLILFAGWQCESKKATQPQ